MLQHPQSSLGNTLTIYIDGLLMLQPLEHGVDDDEASGSPDAGAAVNHRRSGVVWVTSSHASKEGKERRRVLGNAWRADMGAKSAVMVGEEGNGQDLF